ncbi:choice-of-anchor D domain-containing protein [Prolixibacter sp. NT017]|uniref:choice-of-anchor D domain-containing protein n=1 Tax=Prolixibacter sp. NT017 TaxID=2652390 RepID=UPI0012742D5F|nr:choice-of-anchor D domain-containing protein [Prolixibacter sp. NT017]GET25521.1 hypothetical protein NT017_18500 [Prolixibacter sp. NT017]
MKTKVILLLFLNLVLAKTFAATIYVNVHNINGSTVSNAYVILYDNNGNPIKTGYTDSTGQVTFALLDYGTYSYEVYYTGETKEFWGSDERFYLGEPTLTRNFTRDWPYKYSDNFPISDALVNQPVTMEVTVKNNLSFSRDVEVELYVDQNKSSDGWHKVSTSQNIGSNGKATFNFDFTPTTTGTYYWKARVLTFNNGSNKYIPTDSYNWQTGFTANEQTGNLDIRVKNINGADIGNASVKLYIGSSAITKVTNASGIASFTGLNYDTYNYEVYYDGESNEFWGNDNVQINSAATSVTFTRNWPYMYSNNFPISSVLLNQPVTMEITVKNNLSFSRDVEVELYVDQNKSSDGWHKVSTSQNIGSNGKATFNFDFTPTTTGTYYWKARVSTFNDGSNKYIPTDSYNWQTGFTANEQTGNLDIRVKNISGADIENALVKLYNGSNTIVKLTNTSGIASFTGLNYGTYKYEVYSDEKLNEFWGNDSVKLNSAATSVTFMRNWPYMYSNNFPMSNALLNQPVTMEVTVKNNLSFSRDVEVELYVDKNESSNGWHKISTSQNIGSNGKVTFSFNFTPTSAGTYYWKTRVLTFNDGANKYIPTDTYNWQTGFEISDENLAFNKIKGRVAYHVDSDNRSLHTPVDENDGQIYIVDLEKKEKKKLNLTQNGLSLGNAMNPSFNPDGSCLTFMAIPKGDNLKWGNMHVYVYDLADNTLRCIDQGQDPKFNLLGDSIIYKKNRGIWIISSNGDTTSRREILHDSFEYSGPNFSPDISNNIITYWKTYTIGGDTTGDICTMENGRNISTLVKGNESDNNYYPIWKNKDTIMYVNSNLGDDIYFYSLKSSENFKCLFNSDKDDSDPFAISGRFIGFSSNRSFGDVGKEYELCIVDLLKNTVNRIEKTSSELMELGGTYSKFSLSRKLTIQAGTNEHFKPNSSQLVEVHAYSDGAPWQNANIKVYIKGNEDFEFSTFNDGGNEGDSKAGDGIFTGIIKLPTVPGKYKIYAQAISYDNGIQNEIVSDSMTFFIDNDTPKLVVTPSVIDFGRISIGGTSDKKFVVLNDGNSLVNCNLNVSSPFFIVNGKDINLNPGEKEEIEVKFQPNTSGSFVKDVNFSGLDNYSCLLKGEGQNSIIAPQIMDIIDHDQLARSTYVSPVPVLSSGSLPVTWTLLDAPTGATINNQTGVVTWLNPMKSQNPYLFTIQAQNDAGKDEQSWYLKVLDDASMVNYSIAGNMLSQEDNSKSAEINIPVTLQVIGDIENTISVRSDGSYDITGLKAGDYSLIPKENGKTILPDTLVFTQLSENKFNQDFIILSNTPPVFEDQTFSVIEHSPIGTLVGEIVASDTEGDSLQYKILSGNERNLLVMNNLTGDLFVNDSINLNKSEIDTINLKIEVTDNGIGKLSSIATINVILEGNSSTGIGNVVQNELLKIYPNPCSDFLYIRIENNSLNGMAKLQLFDITGKVVLIKDVNLSNVMRLNLPSNLNGIYFLQVNYLGKIFCSKVIIR